MEISLPVTLAVLGAALLHASWNVLVKSGADKELETVNIAIGSGLVALVIALFLPAPAPASWPWVAASAVVHILYFVFLAGAYRWGELSYTYPVMRGGGPMIVALVGALVLGEVLPLHATVGVVFICVGVLAFASGRHDRRAIALWAMTRAPIALVAVLRETSVIFGAAIAALVLKEKFTRRRLAATGAVMVGLIALKF